MYILHEIHKGLSILYKYENLFELDGLINRPFGENSPKITEMNKLHE